MGLLGDCCGPVEVDVTFIVTDAYPRLPASGGVDARPMIVVPARNSVQRTDVVGALAAFQCVAHGRT